MAENPQNLIRSFNLQTNFATGSVTRDDLVPPSFSRIRTPYAHTWRETKLPNIVDWGVDGYSYHLDQSLRVVKSMYLKINLPAITGGGNYKRYPGFKICKQQRLMSAGQEVYTVDPCLHLVDYCESLSDEQVKQFGETFMGDQAVPDATARTVLIPIFLPNTPFYGRAGDRRGLGAFPAFLGQNRLEVQISLNTAAYTAADASYVPASIAGECSILIHQVDMTSHNLLKYSDLRGGYSVINRRFTPITSTWQHYTSGDAAAQTEHTISQVQPQGCITEVIAVAVATGATEDRYSAFEYIKPTSMKITADSIVQKDLEDVQKINIENWEQGFCEPADFPSPGRLCFSAHSADNTHLYAGGYNMSLASNIQVGIRFPSECRFKLYAIAYQRVKIDELGHVRSYLE